MVGNTELGMGEACSVRPAHVLSKLYELTRTQNGELEHENKVDASGVENMS
jgi:hypothetical protein